MTVSSTTSTSALPANGAGSMLEPLNELQNWLMNWLPPDQAEAIRPVVEAFPGLQALQQAQQIHALEHATIWVLSNHPEVIGLSELPATAGLADDSRFHGLSTARGFYLYGPTSTTRLDWSVKFALRQLCSGQAQLAIHPRCGTRVTAQALLTAGLAGVSLALLPRRPLAQLAGLAGAIATAAELSPAWGDWCQANLTTAIPHNLELSKIHPMRDGAGNTAHFVAVNWVARRSERAVSDLVQY